MLIDYNSLRENLNFNKKGRNQEKKKDLKKGCQSETQSDMHRLLTMRYTHSSEACAYDYSRIVEFISFIDNILYTITSTAFDEHRIKRIGNCLAPFLISLSPLSVLFSVRAFLAIADCVRHRNLYNAT